MDIQHELEQFQRYAHIPSSPLSNNTSKTAHQNNMVILRAIQVINKRESPRIADLIDHTLLSSAKCYRGVDILLAKGYVKSHFVNRAKHLDITPKGVECLASQPD